MIGHKIIPIVWHKTIIGQKVLKPSGKPSGKPFKSGLKINTVNGKYVITMCGNRDGVECERKSFTFENGKIVKL